jgi:hypothetical protein
VRFDKFAWSEFERAQHGPEGVEGPCFILLGPE